jgi:two-component system, chemotaxis family, protein-glutamate methylesterase/glutaminase
LPRAESTARSAVNKLLIVDDSPLMRKLLTNIFSTQQDFELRTARDAEEAMQLLHEFKPDVISLDINMPGKNGLHCLRRIMVERPTPVVMFSSLTASGAGITIEAMAAGAVDYMEKPSGILTLDFDEVAAQLIEKIRVAAKAKVRRSQGLVQRLRERNTGTRRAASRPASQSQEGLATASGDGVVLIGVSTGGPKTLEEILPYLPATLPWPVVVAQHMPATFTNALAQRMDKLCPMNVVEVSRQLKLEAGTIYIGRGDADIQLKKRAQGVVVMPTPSSPEYPWHPSVDALVRSAQTVFAPEQIIGVLLTGMGDDGSMEMANLRMAGGHTIAESEESAIVNGMPRELIEKGGAELILSAELIATQLTHWLTARETSDGLH